MVDLVQDDECAARELPNGRRVERHLLIGDHHAVHVGRQRAVAY